MRASESENGGDGSYIAVRGQDTALTAYEAGGGLQAHERIRLRRTVAALAAHPADPRTTSAAGS